MMMLGTAWNLENTYPPLEYMQFVTAFYGDEFAYFYKGHPGNYESNSPENTALYKTINVGMLEPSIAAELFSFFNPDICVSGYESSYFQNTGEASQDFALFRRTKDGRRLCRGQRGRLCRQDGSLHLRHGRSVRHQHLHR